MNIIDHFANEIARKLAAAQDAIIRSCITERIGDSWTDAEILPRMRVEPVPDSRAKMFLLDGKPLVSIWPPESSMDDNGNMNRMTWSMNYRRMPA